jgi:hypothetical protein
LPWAVVQKLGTVMATFAMPIARTITASALAVAGSAPGTIMQLTEYVILFVLVVTTGAGIPGPGDASMIAAGTLAGEGLLWAIYTRGRADDRSKDAADGAQRRGDGGGEPDALGGGTRMLRQDRSRREVRSPGDGACRS